MPYELRGWLDYAEAPGGACRLYIDADDPEAYAGLDGAKINRANTARAKALKPWTEYTMNDRLQWCVAAVPGRAWASRVFPELPTEQAVEKLWGRSISVPVITVPFCSISSRFTRSQLCICWAK